MSAPHQHTTELMHGDDWLQHQTRFLIRVLEIVRTTKRSTEKTLRRQIERAIREEFGFGLYHCGKCGRYKRRTSFHCDRARPNGIRPQCKQCLKPLWTDKYWRNHSQILSSKRAAYSRKRRSG